MTKYLKHKSIYFMHMLTLKQGLHLSKVHSEMKTFMIKRQTKNAPSWSFILMLLMTTNKFFWIWSDLRRLGIELQLLYGIHIWHWHHTLLDMKALQEQQKSHSSESIWGTTLYMTLEVNGTPWSFSFYCPEDSLNQNLDHVFIWTSGVKEDQSGELGHTMMNEENLWRAHLVPHVTFFYFFSL